MTDVNQMQILTNSKDMLQCIQSLSLSSSNTINTFYFFFLYTSPYSTVEKYRFKGLVDFSLHEKENG
jgi:hypothetical protein